MSARRHNFDLARQCHSALCELVIAHPGGRLDEPALRKTLDLCRTALSAVNDAQCIAPLGEVEDLATELFFDREHLQPQRPGMAGIASLKMEILKALATFRARVGTLQLDQSEALAAQARPLQPSHSPGDAATGS
jgi:hypothetical protein